MSSEKDSWKLWEQISTSLCERSCDACKHPNLVSRYLQELTATCAARRRSAFSQVTMASSSNKSEDQMSEYWNRGDEGGCSEEDISQSDESEDSFEAAKSLTKSKSRKLGLEEKLDLLEQAEENYNQSKKIRQANNSISQSLRETSKQRLSNAVLQAQQLLENMNTINVQTAAEVLESECFRQYGKNRTVYHSRVLGTVRWLSTASSGDLANRLGIHHPPSDSLLTKEDGPETLPSSFSEDKLNATTDAEIHGNHCLGTSTSPETWPSYSANPGTSMSSGTTRTSPPHSACSSRKLPAIPSFSEFVNSKKFKANSSNGSPGLSPKRQKRRGS